MSGIEIRPRVPDDDAQIVAMWARAEPDLPPTTVEEYRFNVASLRRDRVSERWVAELDGAIAGTASVFDLRTIPPGGFWNTITVDPDHRRQGIGSRLYDHILERANTIGVIKLLGQVLETETDSMNFALQRAFTPTGNGEQLSRLDVANANFEGFEGLDERLLDRGIRIATLAELGVENAGLMDGLYELDRSTHADEPSSVEWEFDPFDDWRRVLVLGYGRSADWFWVAMHGERPVGLSRLTLVGNDAAMNAFTGVAREYRGRGIARAMKLRTIEWSRRNGIRYHFTVNEAENHRMLAINISLGYQMLPRTIEIARDL